MSEYDNRIYDLITSSEEKFKSSFEIANHLNMVKNRLIKKFWESVEKELHVLNERENLFKIVLEQDVFRRYSKCYLYINNNINVRISYQNLSDYQYIGLWVDNNLANHYEINKYIEGLENTIPDLSKNGWWVTIRDLNEDFNRLDSLLMILPEHSLEHSKRKALELFEYAKENIEHIKYIGTHCFNKNERIG